jgi:NH3-dependent NAD+ synthetase
LKPDQVDQDTLPPYDELDRTLHLYVEEQKDFDAIVAAGVRPDVAADVVRRIEVNEYKRRQAVPGLKITSKAFGAGRRIPIAKHVPDYGEAGEGE